MSRIRFQPKVAIALLIVLVSVAVQFGFAVGVFGPAWLSPILSLPGLATLAWLWRKAERDHQSSQAFTQLVI